jgi:hypothetical protein
MPECGVRVRDGRNHAAFSPKPAKHIGPIGIDLLGRWRWSVLGEQITAGLKRRPICFLFHSNSAGENTARIARGIHTLGLSVRYKSRSRSSERSMIRVMAASFFWVSSRVTCACASTPASGSWSGSACAGSWDAGPGSWRRLRDRDSPGRRLVAPPVAWRLPPPLRTC